MLRFSLFLGLRPHATSDRIRALKSKLQATETLVQSAVEAGPKKISSSNSDTAITHFSSSGLPTAEAGDESSRTLLSIRERLAAAQESRTHRAASLAGSQQADDKMLKTGASHSTALRARLEAMKKRQPTSSTAIVPE